MRRLLVAFLLLSLPARAAPKPAPPEDETPLGQSTTIGYGISLLDAWDIEGAKKFAEEMKKRQPNDPGTKFLLGRVAFEEGQYSDALSLMKDALGDDAARSDDYAVAVGAEDQAHGTVTEETAHFTFRYKPGKDALLIPYAEETMEAAYAALTKDLGYAPPEKVRVEFYPSPKTLAKVSSLTEEAIRTSGTIALCKYNRLMVTSPRALWRGYEWQDTLTHEFTHFLITRASHNRLPIWIQEGIAKYEETRWRGPAGLAMEAGSETLLAHAVKENKLVTFEAMHPSMALLPSQEIAATAFAEVFTAIEWIDHKVGMGGVRTIIQEMKDGKTEEEAVGDAVHMPFAEWEAAWKKSLKSRPAPKFAAMLEKREFKDERQQDTKKEREKSYERGELGGLPTAEARQHAHLGELFRERNRLPSAALEYEKAIAIDGPTFPALARKYALTKLAQGQGASVEKILRASIDAFPDDETNHLLLGRVLIDSGRAAEAKKHLLFANQHDPFDENIHAGLIKVADDTKDEGLRRREQDVMRILTGEKLTWRAPEPGRNTLVGYLRIENPVGARVLIDGVDTGLTTPLADEPVAAGDHVVRLEIEGGQPIEKHVTITPDTLVPFPNES